MTPTAFVQPEPQAAARLQGRVVARQMLDLPTRDAMFALLAAHFAGVDRATFDRDLDEKSCAILLEDGAGVLRGFTTMLVYESRVAGAPVSVIYSGDTIVERAWWGSPVLARTWIGAALNVRADRRTAGRVLAAPHVRVSHLPFPAGVLPRLLPALRRGHAASTGRAARRARATNGSDVSTTPPRASFDSCGRRCSRRISITLPEGRMPDPHIAFFLERNPGFVRGDELVCLTRIDERNLTPAGRRMARPSVER